MKGYVRALTLFAAVRHMQRAPTCRSDSLFTRHEPQRSRVSVVAFPSQIVPSDAQLCHINIEFSAACVLIYHASIDVLHQYTN